MLTRTVTSPSLTYIHTHAQVDIWSIGCILYTMLVGRPPFETANIESTYAKIRTNDYDLSATVAISDAAKDLIRCALDPSPANRPGLAAMRAHPFFAAGFVPLSLPASAIACAPRFDEAKGVLVGSVVAAAAEPQAVAKAAVLPRAREPLRVLNTAPAVGGTVDAKLQAKPVAAVAPALLPLAPRVPAIPATVTLGATTATLGSAIAINCAPSMSADVVGRSAESRSSLTAVHKRVQEVLASQTTHAASGLAGA